MSSKPIETNPSMTILGVMSGSSLDGIDVAVVQVSNNKFDILKAVTLDIDPDLKNRLKNYSEMDSFSYLKLERDWSSYLGHQLKTFISSVDYEIHAIGLHGHTLVHIPDQKLTIQMGNGGVVAAITRIDTVTDFRIQDVLKNGVGTPLVSIIDRNLFTGYDYYLNLGGIVNITHIEDENIIAYDICPGNQVLNHISEQKLGVPYDDGGKVARTGSIVRDLMSKVDLYDYWTETPPKSLDNNWIQNEFISKIDLDNKASDLLHTVTHWIVNNIADQIATDCQKILVTGGGAFNLFLIEKLKSRLPKADIVVPRRDIIEYKESVLMAYLAYKRIKEEPNVLKMVTQADSDTIAGAYYKA